MDNKNKNDRLGKGDVVSGVKKGLDNFAKAAVKKAPKIASKLASRSLGALSVLEPSELGWSSRTVNPKLVKKMYPEASDELIRKISSYSWFMVDNADPRGNMPPRSVVHKLASPKIKTNQDILALFNQTKPDTMVAMKEDTTNMDIKELIKSMIIKELDGYDVGPDRYDGPTQHWSKHQMQQGRISPSQRGVSPEKYQDIVAKEIAMHFCLTVGMESTPFWREFVMIAERVASGELPPDYEYTYDYLPTYSGEDEGRPDGPKMKKDLSYGASAPVITILKHIGGMRECGLKLPESLQTLAFEPHPKYDDDLFDEPADSAPRSGMGIPKGPAKPLPPPIAENIVANIINIIEEELAKALLEEKNTAEKNKNFRADAKKNVEKE